MFQQQVYFYPVCPEGGEGAEYHHIHQNVEAGWSRLAAGTSVLPVAVLPVVDLTDLGHIPEKERVQVCLYPVFPEKEEVQ